MKRRSTNLIFLAFALIFSSACLELEADMADERSLRSSIGRTSDFVGRAANAKAGALLIVGNDIDKGMIYIEGLDYWPKDFIGKQLTLRGKLVFKNHVPGSVVDETGAISQGGNGSDSYVLQHAVVEMDPAAFGFKKLADWVSLSQGQQQEAVRAIIAELRRGNEDPKKFFIKPKPGTPVSKLSFVLRHQDAFKVENLHAPGDPSGKDREATYDPIARKVIFLFYQ